MAEGIAYQNKDILFKILSETYKNKSFAVYGIKLPPIKALMPTNLPKISADERSIDNLFLLEDGSYAIVDYESEYKKINKIKYLNYIARVMAKYLKEDTEFDLRLIIIYTGDVKDAEGTLKTSCFTLQAEQAFLSHMDGDAELAAIQKKIASGNALTDDDLMKLVILPLTVPGQTRKQEMLESVVEVAEMLPDRAQRFFTLSGVIVASDKFIASEFIEQIRRRINMTQLGQMYEKEKIEYANQKVRDIAKILITEGADIIMIMKATGLTEEEILRLRDECVTV